MVLCIFIKLKMGLQLINKVVNPINRIEIDHTKIYLFFLIKFL